MKKLLNETSVYLVTLFSLAGFQALAFVLAPPEVHLAIGAVCLSWDGLLLIGFFVAQRKKDRAVLNRFNQVNDVLLKVFTLTQSQQKRWKSVVDGLAGTEATDPGARESIQALSEGFQRLEALPVGAPQGATQSPEATIDALQTLILLNHALMSNLDEVLSFYHRTYERLMEIRTGNRLNHFRLHESVDFLKMMGEETSQYSERLVLEILGSFKEITQFSKGIGTDVVMTIGYIMDKDNPEGLDRVVHETTAIHATMDSFFNDVSRVITFSEKAVSDNLAQMDRVKGISEAIAEFSESIRMISLNLNIEAARSSQGGGGAASARGFQVLATKLSEFATKARELARQQQDIIAAAGEVQTKSGASQLNLLHGLKNQIPGIRQRLDPFERIVKGTYDIFAGVETKMESLASSIDQRLQAVIGKFQFQDLVRQEQEHLLAMFAHIRDLAEQVSGPDTSLGEKEKLQTWGELLNFFECLASTENERAVVDRYRAANPALSQDGECQDGVAGSVELF